MLDLDEWHVLFFGQWTSHRRKKINACEILENILYLWKRRNDDFLPSCSDSADVMLVCLLLFISLEFIKRNGSTLSYVESRMPAAKWVLVKRVPSHGPQFNSIQSNKTCIVTGGYSAVNTNKSSRKYLTASTNRANHSVCFEQCPWTVPSISIELFKFA